MTVKQLIDMLQRANPDADVVASDIYGEGTFGITGMVFGTDTVDLTGEDMD